MKTDAEWRTRARELGLHDEMHVPGAFLQSQVLLALQLGREMADARAEEIIAKLHAEVPHGVVAPHSWESAMWHAMAVARSTITKPKEPETFTVKLKNVGNLFSVVAPDEASIRADERRLATKEILDRLLADGSGLGWSLRMTGGEPKSREQVLEEALREMPCTCPAACRHGLPKEDGLHLNQCAYLYARHALEWKPE